MTIPKDVDYMTEENFKKLSKYLKVQPMIINGKMTETYAIHREDKLIGYINKKAFENYMGKY